MRSNLRLLPVDDRAVGKALTLVSNHGLMGTQVFDALIAGVMLHHRIPVVITANAQHFTSLGLAAEAL